MRAEQRQGGRAKKRERDPERGTRKGGKIVGRSTCKSKKGGNNTMKTKFVAVIERWLFKRGVNVCNYITSDMCRRL